MTVFPLFPLGQTFASAPSALRNELISTGNIRGMGRYPSYRKANTSAAQETQKTNSQKGARANIWSDSDLLGDYGCV